MNNWEKNNSEYNVGDPENSEIEYYLSIPEENKDVAAEEKVDAENPGNIWLAKSGFGGTEYLMSAFVSEGSKRGLSFNKMAELTSYNPARRYGLRSKGDIDIGLDADLVLVDPKETWTIRSEESESGQGYTPFENQELNARVTTTFLRGIRIYDNNEIIGQPSGQYLKRPY